MKKQKRLYTKRSGYWHATEPKTVRCTPTWTAIMPTLLKILEDPKQFKAKPGIRAELLNLARSVDKINAGASASE